ncbi:DL-methionine transporter permease subunit [Allopusillimonas soli]|uniref:DL-methionine transporter permease subunit n=1 Tax=Allopusillimonas soli TaxID=659016 RepID=A0A853FDR5_9BURK|nr:DL-methionine transporter permease subunit [Allopusillimonas soli]NYT39005.1 DL-methionine transporter permease subunit [Allopusillimonas soli]TEA69555.1 DL-methionine transporter permease subunit [Allopusillimonas soli]
MSPTLTDLFVTAAGETLLAVAISLAVGALLGIPLGVLLRRAAQAHSSSPSRLGMLAAYAAHGVRATPSFIILIVAIALTHLAVGAAHGTAALTLPLSLLAIPFVARQTETALNQAAAPASEDPAALSTRVAFSAALPGIIAGLGVTLAGLVGYSALAGALGAGGLGDFAMRHGYQAFRPGLLLLVALAFVVLAESAQACGHLLAQRLNNLQTAPARRLLAVRRPR